MLLKRQVLDRIAAGEVDLVFRRWKRPTVKAGGQLRTSIGMLEILSVDEIAKRHITVADAERAGYASRAELLRELDARAEGSIHRIAVEPGGEDPRLALRARGQLTADELGDLDARLARLDKASARGPWTHDVLRCLAAHPHVRAQDLASDLGLEKTVLKNDVRKLKALGLTISHSPGYELSPRGKAVLAHLDA